MEGTMTARTSLASRLAEAKAVVAVIAASLALALWLWVATGPSQLINSIITGGYLALLAGGLALVFGVMNIPQFAHGESFMIGASIAYFVFSPIDEYLAENPNAVLSAVAPFVAFAAAAVVGFIVGALIERFIFHPLRHRSQAGWVMNTFLLTVGISFVIVNGATLTIGANFRGIPRYWDVEPVELLGTRVSVDRIVAFVIAMITIGLLWAFLRRTRTGRAIRAVSQDETGAELVGINLDFIHNLTFSLATATAALAGASLLSIFQAYPTVGVKPLYLSWYVVMLAGLGNIAGAIVGGFIVALLQSATQQFIGIAWEDVVPVIVMILLLIVLPSGIFGSEVKGVQEQ